MLKLAVIQYQKWRTVVPLPKEPMENTLLSGAGILYHKGNKIQPQNYQAYQLLGGLCKQKWSSKPLKAERGEKLKTYYL